MKIHSLNHTLEIGSKIAQNLRGGDVIELIGDVGAGKTTLTKGVANGLGVGETVQSPTFTISREYGADRGLRLVHYDFYRLREAGVMADELSEAINDPNTVVIVEWADAVDAVLPRDRLTLRIELVPEDEGARRLVWSGSGEVATRLMEPLQ